MTNKLFFKYLLLCHAVRAQIGGLTQELSELPLEVLLSYPDVTKLVYLMFLFGWMQLLSTCSEVGGVGPWAVREGVGGGLGGLFSRTYWF